MGGSLGRFRLVASLSLNPESVRSIRRQIAWDLIAPAMTRDYTFEGRLMRQPTIYDFSQSVTVRKTMEVIEHYGDAVRFHLIGSGVVEKMSLF